MSNIQVNGTSKTQKVNNSESQKQQVALKNNVQILFDNQKDERDKKLVGGYSELMSAISDIEKEIKPGTYTVKRGDTLSKIAQKQGVSIKEIMKENPKINPDVISVGQVIKLPVKNTVQKAEVKPQNHTVVKNTVSSQQQKIYVVQRGDTLAQIAIRNGVSLAEIKRLNPNINPNVINIGQRIYLPSSQSKQNQPSVSNDTPAKNNVNTQTSNQNASRVYSVKAGDTLWKIGQEFNVSVDQILKANNLKGVQYLTVGQKLKIPAPVINSDMKVDASKCAEYKEAIVKMMKAKGVTNQADIEKISSLITDKSIAMKVDPVLIAGIVGQEIDFRYMSDNIWGVNGKGMMQLTEGTVADLYRCQPGVADCYAGCKDEVLAIMKKYPTAKSLYNAICKKENYALNLEVGIIIFKGKLEIDYKNNPQRSEQKHIEFAVRNYNGNTKKKASGIEIRDDYRNKIMASYGTHKVV